MRHISSVISSSTPVSPFSPASSSITQKKRRITPLSEMSTAHLAAEQRERLQAALSGAARWLSERTPGRAFVVAGPVGTGKTTIVENLAAAMKTAMCAVDWDGRPIPGTEIEISSGRIVNASLLMALLDPGKAVVDGWGEVGRSSLQTMFGRADVVAVDDCGREQIPYIAAANIEAVRQSRYWEFIDWCYRRQKSLLLTTNIPLLVISDGRPTVNPAFVSIMGEAAFSRLYEMAAGFMFDLSGLPDYRRILAKNGGR